MTDKELLQGLLAYFDNVMVDVEAGDSFDKERLPDYRGHEQEFRIDMIVELFNGMMETYARMKSVLMQVSKDGKPLQIRGNMSWANIMEDLDAYEKSCDKNTELKYRKKPVLIDAIRWTGDNYAEIFEFTEGKAYPSEPHSDTLIVSTLEGDVKAERGCYIVRGSDGENSCLVVAR